MTNEASVPRFERPYDTGHLDETVRTRGSAILVDAFPAELRARACAEIDQWLDEHGDADGDAFAGISRGPKALRLQALLSKLRCAPELITQPDVLAWARRMLAPRGTRVLLNAAEYLEREPDESAGQETQGNHRGTDLWPPVAAATHPVAVHAIVALVPFTTGNGGVWLAMDSHRLAAGERPDPRSLVRVLMEPGDAVLFRSDVIHGAGANVSGERRRALSVGYQVDWLRPAENNTLNVSPRTAAGLPEEVQELLGYGTDTVLGRYEAGAAKAALTRPRRGVRPAAAAAG